MSLSQLQNQGTKTRAVPHPGPPRSLGVPRQVLAMQEATPSAPVSQSQLRITGTQGFLRTGELTNWEPKGTISAVFQSGKLL